MPINYHLEEVKLPSFLKKRILNKWIKEIAIHHKKTIGEINYIFCNDEKILNVNKQYLDHDYYTDIITFDYSDKESISGDLFISLDTVKSNSDKFDTTFQNELYRVMIHGILHLCGFKDKTKEEKILMTTNENNALFLLNNYLNK